MAGGGVRAWTWRGRPLAAVPSRSLMWAVRNSETWPDFREACHRELAIRSAAWKARHPRRRWRAREQAREAAGAKETGGTGA